MSAGSDHAAEIENERHCAAGKAGNERHHADGADALLEVELRHGAGQPEPGAVRVAHDDAAGAHGEVGRERAHAERVGAGNDADEP